MVLLGFGQGETLIPESVLSIAGQVSANFKTWKLTIFLLILQLEGAFEISYSFQIGLEKSHIT